MPRRRAAVARLQPLGYSLNTRPSTATTPQTWPGLRMGGLARAAGHPTTAAVTTEFTPHLLAQGDEGARGPVQGPVRCMHRVPAGAQSRRCQGRRHRGACSRRRRRAFARRRTVARRRSVAAVREHEAEPGRRRGGARGGRGGGGSGEPPPRPYPAAPMASASSASGGSGGAGRDDSGGVESRWPESPPAAAAAVVAGGLGRCHRRDPRGPVDACPGDLGGGGGGDGGDGKGGVGGRSGGGAGGFTLRGCLGYQLRLPAER